MKSYVVLTYYHLMHAVAMTLESREKSNLFFIRGYYNVSDEIIENIKSTELFENVIGLDQLEFVSEFANRLAETKDMADEEIDSIGNSIFDECLEPYYERVFAVADKDDDVFVYNDFQRPYYYIAKHFSRIIGVEDGYCMLRNQLESQHFADQYAPIERFVGKYYPEVNFKNKNILKIISSCGFEELPDEIKDKLEIIDFKELVRDNIEKFRIAMIRIFSLDAIETKGINTLYLTSPMARTGYCNTLGNFLVSKRIIDEEQRNNRKVLIKPHPADINIDYSLLKSVNIDVLSGSFPVELLEFASSEKIDSSISYLSSAMTDTICVNNHIEYKGRPDVDEIRKSIKEYTKDEQLIINIYITVDQCSLDSYINVMSWLEDIKYFKKNVVLLVPKSREIEFRSYFSIDNFSERVKEYLAKEREVPFYEEIIKLSEINPSEVETTFTIIGVSNVNEELIYNEFLCKDDFDYFILLDSFNQGMITFRKIKGILVKEIKWGYSFMNYTYLNDEEKTKKVFIGGLRTKNCFVPQLTNMLLNQKIIEAIEEKGGYSTEIIAEVLRSKADDILFKERVHLHIDNTIYSSIEDGYDYYSDIIRNIVERTDDTDFAADQIATAAYQYYNWKTISNKGARNKDVLKFMDELDINSELKCTVYEKFIDALILEKERIQDKRAYKDNEWYEYRLKTLPKSDKNKGKKNQKTRLTRLFKNNS